MALRDGVLGLRAGPGGQAAGRPCRGHPVHPRGRLRPGGAGTEPERSRRPGGPARPGSATPWAPRARPGWRPNCCAEQAGNPHLAARTWLQRWLPERLCGPALGLAGLPEDQRLKDLPRAGRKALLALVRAFPLGEPGAVDLERGEVCAGGVRLEAVDPATMALKGWDNLRVCGELLDVDGPVGGYNLQAAFSTGYAAGS